MTVAGLNLGLATYTAAVRLSHTACERTTWEADTSLRCQVGRGVTKLAAEQKQLFAAIGVPTPKAQEFV